MHELLLLGDRDRRLERLLLHAAHLELGLADHVEQAVHPPGRHAHVVAGAPRRRDLVELVVGVRGLDVEQPRHGHGVGAGERGIERGHDLGDRLGRHGPVGAGQRAAERVGRDEQQVHEVAAYAGAPVAQHSEQVLGAVREGHDAVEPEHARRALDGVRVAEQRHDDLPRRRVLLETEQPVAQRGEPVLHLRAEGGDQLRVVAPGHR